MRIMGVEINAAELRYVIINVEAEARYDIEAANRLTLSDTRSPAALSAFQSAVITTLREMRPDLLAIKSKPEVGRLRAGAAAMKIEGILLANAQCEVDFVSGARVNKVEDQENDLHGYLQPALKCAIAANSD